MIKRWLIVKPIPDLEGLQKPTIHKKIKNKRYFKNDVL